MPKVIATRAWRLEDVLADWDAFELEADIDEGAGWTAYQRGALAMVRRPEDMLRRFGEPSLTLAPGTVLFLGTVPVEGAIRPARAFAVRLRHPRTGEVIAHDYEVEVLPVVD